MSPEEGRGEGKGKAEEERGGKEKGGEGRGKKGGERRKPFLSPNSSICLLIAEFKQFGFRFN